MNRDRDAAPSTLRDALQQFADRDIKLPDTVHAAVAELDRIEASRPQEPAHNAIEQAVLAGADDDAIESLVVQHLGFQLRRNGYAQARLTAAQRALAAARADAPAIHAQLKKLADAIIERLTKVAALGDITLDQLIREGRTDDAKLAAAKEIDAGELTVLHNLRQTAVWPGEPFGVPPVDCSWWEDPTVAEHHAHGTGATYLVSAIRGGAQLWFPTPAEAVDAAQPIATRLMVLAAKDKQAIVDRYGVA